MKYNIRKYATGGGYAVFTPIPVAPRMVGGDQDGGSTQGLESSASKVAAESDPEKGLDKALLEDLYKNGLVNDVTAFTAHLLKLEQTSKFPYTNANTRNQILQTRMMINQVTQNKDYWLKAIDRAKANGGYDEIAVNNGMVFIKDSSNKIKQISLAEFSKQNTKVRALSVAELMYERQYNPSLTNQNGVFMVADNAVGLDHIVDKVKKVVDLLSPESVSETYTVATQDSITTAKQISRELVGKTPTTEQVKSLQQLSKLMQNPTTYAEVQNIVKSERNYLDQALQFLWNTLTKGEQDKWKANAIMNNSDPIKLLSNALFIGSEHSETYSVKPLKDETLFSKPTKSETDIVKPITPFELQHNGKLGKMVVNWNDPPTKLNLSLIGNEVKLWDDVSANTVLKMGPLENLLNSQTGQILDQSKIFFGSKEVAVNDRKNLIIDPSQAVRVMFPTDDHGNPDYDVLKKIAEIKKQAPTNVSPEELTAYYQSHGLDFIEFDDKFNLRINKNFKPFLLLYAYGDEKSSSVRNNAEIQELEGTVSDEAADILQTIYEAEKLKKPTGFLNWFNTYYKGNLLIPYSDFSSEIAASIAGNLLNPRVSLEETKIKREADNSRQISASSNIYN